MITMKWNRFKNRRAGMSSGFLILMLLLLIGCGDGDNGSNSGGSGGSGGTMVDAVVFLAQKDDATIDELYVSIDDGTAITVEKLSRTLVSGGQVVDFAVSPDGRRVAYKADQQVFGKFELYVVPVEGGTAVNVSRQSTNILEVRDFAWSFDSTTIAFRAFNPVPNTVGNIELFTVSSTGGTPVRVSIFPNIDGEVRDFAWAPNSLLLAYTQNVILGTPTKFDLFSTRPFRQDNNQLSNSAGTNSIIATVTEFAWSPSSSLIAFIAEVETTGINELFVADASSVGLAPVSLSRTLQDLGEITDFAWEPDNFRIAYRADQFLDQRFDLLTVLSDGSQSPILVSNLPNSNSVVRDFAWAPDSSRIAYIADQDTVGVFELFTNNAVGTSPRKVSNVLISGENVQAFAWAPDSSLIAYQANQDEVNKFELYTTSPDIDRDFVKVSGTPTSGGLRTIDAFAWAPDSSRIAYIARQASTDFELYTSTPAGIVNDAVAPVPLPSGGDVDSFNWAPDSSRLAYRADQDKTNVPELYSSQPDGMDNMKISGDLVPGGSVADNYEWVP
jgi:hypothetical protein